MSALAKVLDKILLTAGFLLAVYSAGVLAGVLDAPSQNALAGFLMFVGGYIFIEKGRS